MANYNLPWKLQRHDFVIVRVPRFITLVAARQTMLLSLKNELRDERRSH